MENQHTAVVSENTENVFSQTIIFKNEISNFNFEKLTDIMNKLNHLCLKFDPYQPEVATETEKNILKEFKLENSTANPFDFTNIVLQMLDFVENELENRKH